MQLKTLALVALTILPLCGCAAHGPINPAATLYDQSVHNPWKPSTTFHDCKPVARTIYAQGRVYVVNEVQCVDDKGHRIIIN